MKLTVVIVSYNVRHYLEQCLLSLARALDGIEAKVVVVDNHSHDGTVEYLRRRFRHIELVSSNHNLGFARANNIAIRNSSSDYVLLLNPDTFVAEETIARALSFMDAHPQAGALGVRMHNADGTVAMESRRGLPTPLVSFYKMCGLCARYPRSRTFGRYYMSYLPWDSPQRIEVISGAFCLLRRKALDEAGLLDEDFFMYGEDIDLSYRLLKHGWQNWYLPEPIVHYKGESTVKSSFRYVHVFYQAMLIFFRKHYGHLSLWMSLPVKLAIYTRAAAALLSMQAGLARRFLGINGRRSPEPLYVFTGSRLMLKRCRNIARQKGLRAVFFEAAPDSFDEARLPAPSDGQPVDAIYYVFDTDTFSYRSIIDIMSRQRNVRVRVGTFYARNRLIITPEEIIA